MRMVIIGGYHDGCFVSVKRESVDRVRVVDGPHRVAGERVYDKRRHPRFAYPILMPVGVTDEEAARLIDEWRCI